MGTWPKLASRRETQVGSPYGSGSGGETTAELAIGRRLQRIDEITTILARDLGVEHEAEASRPL